MSLRALALAVILGLPPAAGAVAELQVLARNPSLEAAREAWRAAHSRYPQETSLEDPMLSYSMAPLSITGGERFG